VENVRVADLSEMSVHSGVEVGRLPEVMELFAEAWWMVGRTSDDVGRMLQESDVVVVLVHRAADRVVGFARVLTDFTYVALVLDVVVSEAYQGAGLGALLMDSVVRHPKLVDVRSVELVCQPDLVPFYRRWGFTDQVGRSLLMRRTADGNVAERRR
jgi:GNAT superfamily N-acetyltransferase